MFRVAVVNPLRVEVVLPASFYSAVRLGMTVTITPEFEGAAPRLARIKVVDGLIDGASNTFRIRLELPNADFSLPAGLRCKADLGNVIVPVQKTPAMPPAPKGLDTSLNSQMAPVLAAAPSNWR